MPSKVSCILATANRPDFLRQALRYYERQTWSEKELIIIDDSVSPYTGVLPRGCCYIYLDARLNLGAKLNLGIEKATGAIIQKWDDDDYYHPEFLTTTVAALEASESPNAVAFYESFLVLLSSSGKLVFSGHGWQAGATMCFYRAYWEDHRFPDAPSAVDWRFFQQHEPVRAPIKDPEKFIHVRHREGHTWTKLDNSDLDAFFQAKQAYPKALSRLISGQDQDFYNHLLKTPGAIKAG